MRDQPLKLRDEHRTLLFKSLDDPVLEGLSQVESLEDVFSLLDAHRDALDHRHLSQAFIALWDLQKVVYYCPAAFSSAELIHRREQLRGTVDKHPTFRWIIDSLSAHPEALSDDALSCLALFLPRICSSDTGLNLWRRAREILWERMGNMPLSALTRFISALREYDPHLLPEKGPEILPNLESWVSAG